MTFSEDLTVVITTFYSDDKIIDCLNSIDTSIRVIIVENSNRKEFKSKIEKQFNNVECVLAGSNLGYGNANNIGIAKSNTQYVLILNPDAKLEENAIKNFFLRCKDNLDFAIIGPHIQEEHKNYYSKSDHLIQVDSVKGFAMFLNLKQLNKNQVFDENIFIYFEEIDLCRRLGLKGKKVFVDPKIRVYHSGGNSHNQEINHAMELSRNWHWMWSSFYYQKKYRGFLLAFFILSPKLFSALFKTGVYYFFNKKKYEIYCHRLSGLSSAIMARKSWYRPKV